jgi:hypothetical protein
MPTRKSVSWPLWNDTGLLEEGALLSRKLSGSRLGTRTRQQYEKASDSRQASGDASIRTCVALAGCGTTDGIATVSISKPDPAQPHVRPTTSRLTVANRWGHFLARLGIKRGARRVEPGLYALGNPTPESPVFVSANYTLSFDALRSALGEIEGYILVLDTEGINVWCAAGKGTASAGIGRMGIPGLGASVKPLTSGDWVGLPEGAGLREIVVRTYEIDTRNEARGILRRYGCRGMLGVLCRTLSLCTGSPAYRRFVKEQREGGVTPENLDEYFGCGLYVGRK